MKRKKIPCSNCGGMPKIVTEDGPHVVACSKCGKETIAWALPLEAWKQWETDNYKE